MELFFEIQLDSGAKYKASGDDTLNLNVGDDCVIRKDFFLDFGKITKAYRSVEEAGKAEEAENAEGGDGHFRAPCGDRKQEVPRIQRKATVVDLGKANENTMRTKSALRTTQQYVEKLNLPMKLINAHYSFDGKLITIQFSADGRVDFRELVKVLSQEFNTRIELRQIGVRDETAIIGGISVCGRPLCCCMFLKDFASINVKMAKEQDLSLTPSTISGICGRLKCCLKYEHEGYLELEAGMPRRGDCCECKDGRGRVIDRNLLTGKVVIQLDESGRNVTYLKDEVNVVYPDKYKVRGGSGNNGGDANNGNRGNRNERNGDDANNGNRGNRNERNGDSGRTGNNRPAPSVKNESSAPAIPKNEPASPKSELAAPAVPKNEPASPKDTPSAPAAPKDTSAQ